MTQGGTSGIQPLEKIAMDLVGSFKKHDFGLGIRKKFYVMTEIETFSRYARVRHIKNARSESLCKEIRECIEIYGASKAIITGKGTSFTSL